MRACVSAQKTIGHLLETFLRHFYYCNHVRACSAVCDHVQSCPTMCEHVQPCATVFNHAQLPEWPTVQVWVMSPMSRAVYISPEKRGSYLKLSLFHSLMTGVQLNLFVRISLWSDCGIIIILWPLKSKLSSIDLFSKCPVGLQYTKDNSLIHVAVGQPV